MDMVNWGNSDRRVIYNSIAIICVLLGIIGFLIYYYFINADTLKTSSATRIIPNETAFVVSYNDPEPLLDWLKSSGANNFVEDNFINTFEKLHNELILLSKDANILSNTQTFLCLHPSIDTNQVYSILIDQERLSDVLDEIKVSKLFKGQTSISGNDCYTLQFSGESMYIMNIDQYIVLSNQPSILEKYILSSNEENTWISEPQLNYDLINVYINYPILQRLSQNLISSALGIQLGTFDAVSTFSYSSNQEITLMNGSIDFSENDYSLTPFINNNQPAENTLLEVLPENNLGFIQISYGDISAYLRNIQAKSTGTKNSKYGIDINLEVETWLGKEINVCIAEVNKKPEKFVFVKTFFPERALKMIESMARVDQAEFKDFKFVESFQNQSIYFINDPGLLQSICGNMATDIQRPYCYIFDDIIVFSNKLESIQYYMQLKEKSALFYNQEIFGTISNYLNKTNNILVYLNIDALQKNVKLTNFKKFSSSNKALVYELSNTESGLSNNMMFVHRKPSANTTEEVALKAKLDAPPIIKPSILVNHNTNAYEIFVQDQNFNIYLISNKGKILWKKNVGELILSDVYQIDYYNNKKLQILFNTKSKVHCYDRLGNTVESYPLSLTAPASSGLLLTNYNNQSEPRIFVPLFNNNIQGFTIKGKALSGWDPQKEKEYAPQPLQYVYFGNKDYLVSTNIKGSINIFNRRGRKLKEIESKEECQCFAPFYFTKSTTEENSYWLTMNDRGHILKTTFDGKQSITENIRWKNTSRLYVEDIASTTGNEWIVFEKDQHFIYAEQQEVSSFKYPSEMKENVFFGQLGNNDINTLFVSDKVLNQVYAFDEQGKVLEGFPKEGSTKGSICNLYNDTTQYLVIGSNDGNLIAYTLK